MIDHETPNLIHILYHLAIMLLVTGGIVGCIHLVVLIGLRRYKFKEKDISQDGLNRGHRRQTRAEGKKNRRLKPAKRIKRKKHHE